MTATLRRPGRLVLLWPRILFGAALAEVLGALVLRRSDMVAVGLLLGYLGWLLCEVPVTFRRAAAAPADSATLLPYALARLGVLGGALVGSGWRWWPAVLVFGAGVALRQVAIRTLGRFYSHHVIRHSGHRIITSGPYRVIRHPAYAGMLLAHTGFAAYFANPVSLVALALLGAAVAWRIHVEERTLWAVPGYTEYATHKARLMPGVW